MSLTRQSAKRGDTLIEVMFAIAVFSFVTVITIAMMNSGLSTAENSLELVTARNELNAQAEALRFVHSSYISEKTLPLRTNASGDDPYQQYAELWDLIVSNAVDPADAQRSGLLDLADFVSDHNPVGASGCSRVYDSGSGLGGRSPLSLVNAFVLNTRDLSSMQLDASGRLQFNTNVSYISVNDTSLPAGTFSPATLNARLLFTNSLGGISSDQFLDAQSGLALFNRVYRAEGIWAFAVTDGTADPKYYDFYIDTCWYGSRTVNPTVIDTVIRLYNPENV